MQSPWRARGVRPRSTVRARYTPDELPGGLVLRAVTLLCLLPFLGWPHGPMGLVGRCAAQGTVGAVASLTPEAPVQTVESGQWVTLPTPPGSSGPFRLVVGEPSGAVLDELKVESRPGPDGSPLVTARLDADPGRYFVQLLSLDTTRAPLATRVLVVVPGVVRRPGCWLFDGSPILVEGQNDDPANAGPAHCLPHLGYQDASALPLTIAKTAEPMKWRVLSLPPLIDLMAKGYDFFALEANLRAEFTAAHGTYVGWELPSRPDGDFELLGPDVQATITKLRGLLDEITPGAALVLRSEVVASLDPDPSAPDHSPNLAAQDVDAAARYCDAVHLDYPGLDCDPWPIKVARRNAEDRAKFDLPVLVSIAAPFSQTGSHAVLGTDQFLLSYLGAGASNLIVPPDASLPLCYRLTQRNLNWWLDWVTLEDTPLLPPAHAQMADMYAVLQNAGRLPMLGRVPAGKEGTAESLFARLDDSTTADTLDGLKDAAARGAALYLQGAPNLTDKTLLHRMEDLSDCTITPLERRADANLVLDDLWTFGGAKGGTLPVTQRLTLAPRPVTKPAVKKPGDPDDDSGPRFPAHLDHDTRGMVASKLGKGTVLWLPDDLPDGITPGAYQPTLVAYYAAVAGSQSPALVSAVPEPASPVVVRSLYSVGLRRTPKNSLVLFFCAPPGSVWDVTVRTKCECAYDLVGESEVPVQLRGYQSSFKLTVPEGGCAVVALPLAREEFAKERAVTRLTARLHG